MFIMCNNFATLGPDSMSRPTLPHWDQTDLVPTDYVNGDKLFPSDYVCGKGPKKTSK